MISFLKTQYNRIDTETKKKILWSPIIFVTGYTTFYVPAYAVSSIVTIDNDRYDIKARRIISHVCGQVGSVLNLFAHSPPMAFTAFFGYGLYRIYDDYKANKE